MLPFLVTLFPDRTIKIIIQIGRGQNEFTKTENERCAISKFFVIRELPGPVAMCDLRSVKRRFPCVSKTQYRIPWRGGDFIKSTWQPARMEISINLFSRSI